MKNEPDIIGAGNGGSSEISSSAVESNPEDQISGETAKPSHWKRRVTLIGGITALLAAAVVLPPLINIGSYKRQVTALMTRSLGRPAHMSSVELRLLPRPGFVLNDLSVSEDAGFGAEPILSARTVVASIRILSLWGGKLEVSRVSVDDASLNLVRSAQGRWNLESLMMGRMIGAQPAATGGIGNLSKTAPGISANFPYLEATNSRVNLKNGVEKSPFSVVGTDLSLWQDKPGEWRVRLRGQPVRTDMEMSLADTGEVQVEGSLRSAAELREMPLKLELGWRDAQLGQLSRLLFGSDAGWRGGVTADISVQGTPDDALTKARLRATGVRREEFAPETPLDFDANCSFRYQHSQNAIHDVGCDTAIGDGRLHLKADLPGSSGAPEAMLEVKQLPLQAGLDMLRTLRSGFAPGLSVKGTASGSLTYKEIAVEEKDRNPKKRQPAQRPSSRVAGASSAPTNLHGAFIIDGAQVKGGGLKEPLTLPRITLTPMLVPNSVRNAAGSVAATALGTRFTIALAPAAPAQTLPGQSGPAQSASAQQSVPQFATPAQAITVRLGLGARGYGTVISGSAGVARARDLAYAFGLPHLDAMDSFAGGTADFDLTAAGPWIPSSDSAALTQPAASSTAPLANVTGTGLLKTAQSTSTTVAALDVSPGIEMFSGSLRLHHTQWKQAYLVSPVDLTLATVTLTAEKVSLTSDFSYGNVRVAGQAAGKDTGKDTGKGAATEAATTSATTPAKNQAKGPAETGSVTAGSVTASQISSSPILSGRAIAGTVTVSALTNCKAADCKPQVLLHFGALDANVMQAVLLGAPEQKTLLSPLIDRMQSSERPKWPEVAVTAQADSLVLGPATLLKPVVRIQFKGSEVVFESWTADLLGGSAKGTGSFAWTGNKPGYAFDGSFSGLNAASVGAMLGSQWTGGPVSGSGSVQLSGATAKDLAASASGDLKFDWVHGSISTAGSTTDPTAGAVTGSAAAATASQEASSHEVRAKEERPEEVRFDDWSGTAKIQGGKVQVGENALRAGKRSSSLGAVIPFGGPVKLAVGPSAGKLAANAAQTTAPAAAKPPAVK